LLTDRRCTVHWDYADSFAEAFPDIALCNDLFVVDGSILNCAGATAALDMMLQLIGAHHGQDLARQISGQFLHGGIRAAADDQRRMLLGMGVTNSVVQKAVSLMEAAIEEPVPLSELTQPACRSASSSACANATSAPRRRNIMCGSGWSAPAACCGRPTCPSRRSPSPAASSRSRISPRSTGATMVYRRARTARRVNRSILVSFYTHRCSAHAGIRCSP
jgi:hypothetical protein